MEASKYSRKEGPLPTGPMSEKIEAGPWFVPDYLGFILESIEPLMNDLRDVN